MGQWTEKRENTEAWDGDIRKLTRDQRERLLQQLAEMASPDLLPDQARAKAEAYANEKQLLMAPATGVKQEVLAIIKVRLFPTVNGYNLIHLLALLYVTARTKTFCGLGSVSRICHPVGGCVRRSVCASYADPLLHLPIWPLYDMYNNAV